MNPFFVLAAAASAPLAATSPQPWLTITGDVGNNYVNTIQVNPAPVDTRGNMRTLEVRVSRSVQRTSWDGVPYRSYKSTVQFDCTQRTARYERIEYFPAPYWTGAPTRAVSYLKGVPRWMLFRDVEPNPNQQIIAAACAPIPGVAKR